MVFVHIVMIAAIFVLTIALWRGVGLLYAGLDLPPAPRRKLLRKQLRIVGIWELAIGFFLASEGDIVNAITLFVIGLGFLLAPNVVVGGSLTPRPGELPDLRDHKDVERWLEE